MSAYLIFLSNLLLPFSYILTNRSLWRFEGDKYVPNEFTYTRHNRNMICPNAWNISTYTITWSEARLHIYKYLIELH